MTVEVSCPECGTTHETYYGESGYCNYCQEGYITAPAHPAQAA